jgi:hypothetical protein
MLRVANVPAAILMLKCSHKNVIFCRSSLFSLLQFANHIFVVHPLFSVIGTSELSEYIVITKKNN